VKDSELLEKEYFFLRTFILKRKNNIILERSTFKKKPLKSYFRYKWQQMSVDGGLYPTLYDILQEEFNDLNIKRTIIVENELRQKRNK
jgi:hypothetical protein